MYGFTTVDGFMNVNQSLEEMIKYLANEPSVGLFYVQQHVQNAMPNLVNLKDKVVEKSRETTMHAEDLEDSILAVRSMGECGFLVADDMIKDISRTLYLLSTCSSHPGLIQKPSWCEKPTFDTKMLQFFRYSSRSTVQDDMSSSSYLSSVFKSTKKTDSSPREKEFDASVSPAAVIDISSLQELRSSYQTEDHQIDGKDVTSSSSSNSTAYKIENYEQFTSERQAKLDKWLEES